MYCCFPQDTWANWNTQRLAGTLCPGTWIEVTDRADLGIDLFITDDNHFDIGGFGGFLNADFQHVGDYSGVSGFVANLGIWTPALSPVEGNVVIWSPSTPAIGSYLHYVNTTGSYTASAPDVDTVNWSPLAKSTTNGYIEEWDIIEYDFVKDWLLFRSDKRGNRIAYSELTDTNYFAEGIPLPLIVFEWGNDKWFDNISNEALIDQQNSIGILNSNTLSTGAYISSNILPAGTSIINNTLEENAFITLNAFTGSSGSIHDNTLESSASIQYNTIGTDATINYNILETGAYIYNNSIGDESSIGINTLEMYAEISDNTIATNCSIALNTLESYSGIINNMLSDSTYIEENVLEEQSTISQNLLDSTMTTGAQIVFNKLFGTAGINMNTLDNAGAISSNTLEFYATVNGNAVTASSIIDNFISAESAISANILTEEAQIVSNIVLGGLITSNTASDAQIMYNTVGIGAQIVNNVLDSDSLINYNVLDIESQITDNTLGSTGSINNNTLCTLAQITGCANSPGSITYYLNWLGPNTTMNFPSYPGYTSQTLTNYPAYQDDYNAGFGGLVTGMLYQTTGTGGSPLDVAGIVMVKQP